MNVEPRVGRGAGRGLGRDVGRVVLTVVLVVEGVAAVVGGVLLLADPFGAPMGMSVTMLDGTPFASYLIPGLLLTLVLGVYPLLVAVLLWRRPAWRAMAGVERLTGCHWCWSAVVAAGVAMVLWIAVQVALLGPVSWVQAVIAAMGLGVLAAAFMPQVRGAYAATPVPARARRRPPG